MDREKVIKALECCKRKDGNECKVCPYTESEYCTEDMVIDALDLLKEQQKQIDCLLEENASNAEMAEGLRELLKEQGEQKRKWLQTIADTQLAISPTGYESEDELAKRGWEWNGLQMAWEIIAGEERSEHPMLIRCKDCKHGREPILAYRKGCVWCERVNRHNDADWYCADGERKSD